MSRNEELHMDFDALTTSAMTSMVSRQTQTVSVESKTTETQVSVEKKSLIDEIREKGFQAFLKELEQKKMEDLRKKILGSMGLSEEDLQKMPAEQRAQIEKMVSQEIVKRMLANAQMNTENGTSLAVIQTVQVDVQVVSSTSMMVGGVGMGPLLALQESELQEPQANPERIKKTG